MVQGLTPECVTVQVSAGSAEPDTPKSAHPNQLQGRPLSDSDSPGSGQAMASTSNPAATAQQTDSTSASGSKGSVSFCPCVASLAVYVLRTGITCLCMLLLHTSAPGCLQAESQHTTVVFSDADYEPVCIRELCLSDTAILAYPLNVTSMA